MIPYEINNISLKYMYMYNIYVKYIQDIFSLIFQHIFIPIWESQLRSSLLFHISLLYAYYCIIHFQSPGKRAVSVTVFHAHWSSFYNMDKNRT